MVSQGNPVTDAFPLACVTHGSSTCFPGILHYGLELSEEWQGPYMNAELTSWFIFDECHLFLSQLALYQINAK